MAAVSELARVLRVGGRALVYVWAMEQSRNNAESTYISRKGGKAKHAQGSQGLQCIDSDGALAEGRDGGKDFQLGTNKENNSICDIESNKVHPDTESSLDENRRHTTANQVKPSQSSDRDSKPPSQLSVHINRTQFESQDLLVPWHLKEKSARGGASAEAEKTAGPGDQTHSVYHRYYHVFEAGELEALCAKVDKVKLVDSYYDQGNWCVVIEKTA